MLREGMEYIKKVVKGRQLVNLTQSTHVYC